MIVIYWWTTSCFPGGIDDNGDDAGNDDNDDGEDRVWFSELIAFKFIGSTIVRCSLGIRLMSEDSFAVLDRFLSSIAIELWKIVTFVSANIMSSLREIKI